MSTHAPSVLTLKKVPKFIGVCVRAGTMDKTIKVRTAKQRKDTFLQKHFKIWPTYLVHDPYNSCRTGDVVRFQQFPTYSRSKRVRHAVTEILAAHGPRLEDRPPVMSKIEQEEKLRTVLERQQRRTDRKVEDKKAAALTRMAKRAKNLGTKGPKAREERMQEYVTVEFEKITDEFEKLGVVQPVRKEPSAALSRDKKAMREYWDDRRVKESATGVENSI